MKPRGTSSSHNNLALVAMEVFSINISIFSNNMPRTKPRTITIIRVSRLRRMSMRVNSWKEVVVRAWNRISESAIQKFVAEKDNWIQKQISSMDSLVPLPREKLIELRKLAQIFLPDRVEYLAKKYDFTYTSVTCRHQTTRWWSCSFRNRISLNTELMRLPAELRDYIILHELTHTRHKHHQKGFWNYLEIVLPWAKELDKKMKKWKIGFENK